jgi:serine/threonine protein kinase
MGTVYRARDTVLDREVALKTIRTGVEVEPELRERFYREARACARLQHPSIVVVHDLGEIDRTAYIAMELLRGFDFRKLIDSRAETPLPIKIEAMAQVCEALAHAHRHGIIHRDVKPSNLFLVDGRLAKVLDFGIARLPSSKLTVAGKILGTPNYMAPEQIMVQPVDARADLFSAAVVFFEFLVFVHPFKSDVISRRIVQGEPDSLFDYDSKLPAPLEKIFERALAKAPDARYQTGDEMAADLRAVLDALLQNASPSFSRVQLPSDREIRTVDSRATLSDADTSLLRPPPPGEDLHEWHLSELMRLIPEFETAVGRHDVASARQAFRQLEAIGAVDSRFVDAVQLCRVRLSEAESDAGAAGTAPPPLDSTAGRPAAGAQTGIGVGGDPATTPKTCGYCGATNRRAAAYCIKCGGRLPAAPPPEPVVPPETREPLPEPAPIEVGTTAIGREPPQPVAAIPDPAPVAPPTPEPAPIASPVQAGAPRPHVHSPGWIGARREQMGHWPSRRLWVAGSAIGLALCLVVGSILFLASRPVRVEPAAARAQVAPASAVLYKDAKAGSSITKLLRGARVNVLALPSARDQVWIAVQVAGPKALRPGYMRIADLGGWDSTDPRTKLTLIRFFRNTGSASDAEIRTETQALQQLVERFPGTKVAHEAQLDLAQLDLSAARRMKSAGEPLKAWSGQIESARNHLDGARGEPSLNSEVDDKQQQIESLLADSQPGHPRATPLAIPGAAVTGSGNAPPAQTKKASKKKIDDLLKKAQDLLERRDWDGADSVLSEVEKSEHDNRKAIELRGKIDAERKMEKYQ